MTFQDFELCQTLPSNSLTFHGFACKTETCLWRIQQRNQLRNETEVQTHVLSLIKRTSMCTGHGLHEHLSIPIPPAFRVCGENLFNNSLCPVPPFSSNPLQSLLFPWRLCKEFQLEELTSSLTSPFMNRTERERRGAG